MVSSWEMCPSSGPLLGLARFGLINQNTPRHLMTKIPLGGFSGILWHNNSPPVFALTIKLKEILIPLLRLLASMEKTTLLGFRASLRH